MLKSPLVRFKIFKFINHIQTNIMENKDKDLGDKKMNGKQSVNEGFSGENIQNDFSNEASKLRTEIETDTSGNKKIVDRARDIEGTIPEEERSWNENESLSRGVDTEEEVMKTIENIDRNSDITPNRYPNSHPENHKDTGAK